jgi:diguanylate cyclase (GGDEF)-like protein/PAS domain S-box-containing protein
MKDFGFNFSDIVEFAKDIIIVTKANPIDEPGPEIVYVNKAFTELTGYSQNEVLGKTPRILQGEKTDPETKKIIRQGLEQQIPIRVTIKNYSKEGKEYWLDLSILPLSNPQGVVTHFVAIERDVTELINLQEQLEILSRTDPLTGLLNRRAFDEILESEFSRYKRNRDVYSLLILDIDHFKLINDKYGHPTGDVVLKSISNSCKTNLRAHDNVARYGGEEFCVLLPSTNALTAYEIAEKLRKIISNTSIPSENGGIRFTVSVGVSEVYNSDINHSDILDRADENLYKAKKTGRNRVCV